MLSPFLLLPFATAEVPGSYLQSKLCSLLSQSNPKEVSGMHYLITNAMLMRKEVCKLHLGGGSPFPAMEITADVISNTMALSLSLCRCHCPAWGLIR